MIIVTTNRASSLLLLHLLPLLDQAGVRHHLHLVRHVCDRCLGVTLEHQGYQCHQNLVKCPNLTVKNMKRAL